MDLGSVDASEWIWAGGLGAVEALLDVGAMSIAETTQAVEAMQAAEVMPVVEEEGAVEEEAVGVAVEVNDPIPSFYVKSSGHKAFTHHSQISIPWRFVIQPQKLKDFLFLRTQRYRFLPMLIRVIFPPVHSSMITQLYSLLRSIESHGPIEHVTACEIKQSVGVFVHWVVLNIDSVVDLFLVLADTHIG